MSAVDAPPGLDFAGLAEGEFRARRGARRFARAMVVLVSLAAGASFAIAARHPFRAGAEIMLVLPLTCEAIALLGYAVRRARLNIGPTGIRWGWAGLGFRMGPSRIRSVTMYRDAAAVEPKRGSTWYVSARDWEDFSRLDGALRRAKMEFRSVASRAPLRSRLQSYGLVLDLLMLGAALLSVLLLFFGIGG